MISAIADRLEAFATRLETTRLPVDVIASEARDLAVLARGELESTAESFSSIVNAREREISERDETIAALRAELAAVKPADHNQETSENDADRT